MVWIKAMNEIRVKLFNRLVTPEEYLISQTSAPILVNKIYSVNN